ncbi:MAG TPA: c-type cytochrome [Anaerolineae bacterium]
MNTRIFIGIVLFLVIFVVLGYVLLTEGLLDVQAQDRLGRMQVFDAGYSGRSLENGAAIFDQYCTSCHGTHGEGVPGKGPQLYPYLFTTRFPELRAANYPNSLRNFIKIAIAGGRPDYTQYWAGRGETYAAPMQTWGQSFGGPLRDDQIEYLTDYILSWEATASLATSTPAVPFEAIGSDLAKELPQGDAARGQQVWDQTVRLASGQVTPCKSCHALEPGSVIVGPSLAGIGSRAGSTVSGQDATTYLRHSTQAPSEHIVEGGNFSANGKSLMPDGLGDSMSAQDLADLIAYLLTLQ